MTWNHRIIRTDGGWADEGHLYQIHECYYESENEEIPTASTEKPTAVSAESVDGLRWMLKQMVKCLGRPVLEYDEEKKEFSEVKTEKP